MSGELILVVDDSREIVKHLTEYLLPNLGYRAVAAYDGREGLEVVRAEEPDLVMLDLNLPEMTGLDVLQTLARDSMETPVVLMTGYGSEKDAIEAFRLGIKDYLVKPFTIDEVADTIERALLESRLRYDKRRLIERLRRTEAEMRRQIKEMRTLFSMGKLITSSLHMEQVLDQVLQSVMDLTTAERATIWLPDADRRVLHAHTKSRFEDETTLPSLSVEDTVVGEVFSSGQAQRQSNFSGSGVSIKTGFLARAILYVPLTARGQVTGVLAASNHEAPRAFSERDELLLAALGDYVAIGLENARTYQAADQALTTHMEELETLLRITRTITSSLDLDEVARLTIKEVHESWDIEASSIWLLDEPRQNLRVLVNVGTSAEILTRYRLEVGRGIVGHVVESGETLYTNDVPNHPLHYREIDAETGFETRSILCVPLVFNQEIIGALQLLNKRDGLFGEEDVERASSIAIAVAIAVSNARLFAESNGRQQLLEAMLEHNGNPIFITDTAGNLLLLNRQAREQFDLASDVIGQPATDVLSHPELAAMLSHEPPVQSDTQQHTQQREVELEDGSFWLCTLAPIPRYGRILVLQNITYLKELDSAKSHFVATVSHDLRAPLNSISGFASALSEVGPLNEKQEEFVSRISHSTERMMNLVTALLDLARIDSRLEQVRQPCDVAGIVRSVLTDLQGQAMTRQVSLTLDVDEEPGSLYADPTQIRQAVSNLVDNAIKYSEAGSDVDVSLSVQDDNVLIRVCDNGRGIAPKDIPHIFEKFYQVHESAGGGSGLGLTLVRSIAEAHGGWVWVESEQNRGSIFTLQLPLSKEGELTQGADANGQYEQASTE